MKNNALLFVLLLLFATSCVFTDVNSPVGEPEPGDTYLSLRSSQILLPPEVGDVESITIQSLRIIVFSKATGRVVTNKVFDISELSLTEKDPNTDYWIVDFSDIVVATKPGESIVYVVLNEDISSISGQTLTGVLNKLSTLIEMQNLVNTPLSYTTPLRVTYGTDEKPLEPPFIMSTFGEFDIPEGMDRDNPYHADLTGVNQGFKLDRTMAKVTIESLSSYPIVGGPTTNNVATSYIFILKMGLINVPKQYLWSPNRPQSATVPPIYNGDWGYQDIDFGLEDPASGYYDRTWNGSITATATATVKWTQYGTPTRRIYKIAKNAGINSYSTTYNGYLESTTTPSINQGNFPTFFIKYFTDGEGGIGLTEFDQGDLDYPTKSVTGTINPAYWELNQKDISYYVPEHILSDKTNSANATKLHVKAAIASMPEFDPNTVSFTKEMVDWGTGPMPNEPSWTYPPTQIIAALIEASFRADPVYDANKKLLGYTHSWGGPTFYRYATGEITLPLGDVDFAHITDSKNIKDFYLPIQNKPTTENPTDYNIYRNNEYRFSVHVLRQWEPTTVTGTTATTKNAATTPEESMVLRFERE